MGSKWETVRLNEVATLRNGAGVKQQFFADNGIPLARVSDFTLDSIDISDCKYVEEAHAETWASHYIDVGDVLVSTVGSWPPNWFSVVGKVVRAPVNVSGAIQNQNTCCILPNQAVLDNRYLFYRLKSEDFTWHTSNNAGGSANQARLPVKKLGEFQFLLPPLSVQRLIANILGALDDKITLNSQTNQTLEKMAQTLFKSWFVDFDPVKAKMNGEQPKGMDAITASLFPEKLVESELGLIPDGWEAGTVGSVTTAKGGYAFKSKQFVDEGNPVIKIKNISSSGTVNTLDCQCIDDDIASTASRFKLSNGDLLMAMTGATVGKSGIYVSDGRDGYLNQRVARFESKVDSSNPCWFTYNLVTKDSIFEQIVGAAQGSAQPNISSKGIEQVKAVIPTHDLIGKYQELVAPLYAKWISNFQENSQLSELRDTLLPKLLSGEIDLESVQVEAVKAIAE